MIKKSQRVISDLVKASVISGLLMVTTSANAKTVKMDGPDTPHMSTTQVKTAVKKKHKGKVIYIERKPTGKHPNCHIVKMLTTQGAFRYIRYACGKGS